MSIRTNQTSELKNLYLKNNLAQPIVKKDNNASLWDIYSQYDTNGNEELSETELNSLNETIKKHGGNFSELAKFWGVSVQKVKEAIGIINADSLATDVYKAINPGLFEKTNLPKAKELLLQVDKNNVRELFYYYNEISNNTSLLSTIDNKFTAKDKTEIISKIETTLKEAAKEQGVKIDALIDEYSKTKDLAALEEIAFRLEIEARQDGYIEKNYNKEIENAKKAAQKSNRSFAPEKMIKMTGIQEMSIEEKANDLKIEYNSQIQEGDGIIGNQSAVGVDVHSKLILNALNNLMKKPEIKERLQAAYKKDSDMYSIVIPDKNQQMTLSENQLASEMRKGKKDKYNDPQVNYGVIGDGDTNALVITILKLMRAGEIKLVGSTYKEQLSNLEKSLEDIFNPRK